MTSGSPGRSVLCQCLSGAEVHLASFEILFVSVFVSQGRASDASGISIELTKEELFRYSALIHAQNVPDPAKLGCYQHTLNA